MEENRTMETVNETEVKENKTPETPVTPDKPEEKKDGIFKIIGKGIAKVGKGVVNGVKAVAPAIGEGVTTGLMAATSVVVAVGALTLAGKAMGLGNEDCEDDLKIVDEGPSPAMKVEEKESEPELVEAEVETEF